MKMAHIAAPPFVSMGKAGIGVLGTIETIAPAFVLPVKQGIKGLPPSASLTAG
jgi:hypothetical protein